MKILFSSYSALRVLASQLIGEGHDFTVKNQSNGSQMLEVPALTSSVQLEDFLQHAGFGSSDYTIYTPVVAVPKQESYAQTLTRRARHPHPVIVALEAAGYHVQRERGEWVVWSDEKNPGVTASYKTLAEIDVSNPI
jgi:hypothetical protein